MTKRLFILLASFQFLLNHAFCNESIFSWVSDAGTVTMNGGNVEQKGYTRFKCINFRQGGNYTLLLLGKKECIDEEEPTRNSAYLEVTLSEGVVFHAKDTIRVKAFRYGAESDKATINFYFNNGAEIVDDNVWTDINPPRETEFSGGLPGAKSRKVTAPTVEMDVHDFIVPAAAKGATTLRLTRDLAEAYLYISQIEVYPYEGSDEAADEDDDDNKGDGDKDDEKDNDDTHVEKDALAQEAYDALLSETSLIRETIDSYVYGVNIFQYAPATKDMILEALEEAERQGDALADEAEIYALIDDLRSYVGLFRPTLPKSRQYFILKHKTSQKYLGMDNGVVLVADASKATPVQFHLTNYPSITNADMTSYIYSTDERKYLGYKNDEVSLVNSHNSEWGIYATHYNAWFIYNPTTRVCLKADKEGKKVTLAKSTAIGDVEGYAPNNEYNPVEDALCEWMLISYEYPETPAAETEKDASTTDDATAITSACVSERASAIFNASGVRTMALGKGVNIIKMSNGKVVKVMK